MPTLKFRAPLRIGQAQSISRVLSGVATGLLGLTKRHEILTPSQRIRAALLEIEIVADQLRAMARTNEIPLKSPESEGD